MKFKTFKFMYMMSSQTIIWLVLALGYFRINIFFSIFSAFLTIVGIICNIVFYLKVNKLTEKDGLYKKCQLNKQWYQNKDRSVGV